MCVCVCVCVSSAPVTSLPSLEWPLRSSTEQLELLMEVQPKSYHRAHYETEGSRGAVKAPTGGHPVVQVRRGRGTTVRQRALERREGEREREGQSEWVNGGDKNNTQRDKSERGKVKSKDYRSRQVTRQ